jgi:hypothetical protein
LNTKQIVEAIKVMKDRDNLAQIINAAEARDCHLSNIESDERRKRAWSHFSHLKKGDTVFIHKNPTQPKLQWMWAKPLTITEVRPRAKEIVVRGDKRGVGHKLTALMALDLKLSETPTSAAFDHALAGEDPAGKLSRAIQHWGMRELDPR